MKGATFNQIKIFQSIVREGSIRGAARILEMAPPTVSQALKQLESEIGLPLFTRTTRRIELTEAGKLLDQRISGAINTLDYAFESVRDMNNKPSGRVRITLPRFVFQFFLQPIYAEFCERYPSIQLEISVTDRAVNILEEGYDVGIRFGERVEQGMVARQIVPPMKEALFASEEYLKKYGNPRSPRDLQGHKLIQYRFISSNQLAPLILKENKQSVTVQMPIALIVNDTDAMIDAAVKGIGIGRMVEPMIQEKLDQGLVHPILANYWESYSGLHLYFMQNSQKALRVRTLIDFLLEKGNESSAAML